MKELTAYKISKAIVDKGYKVTDEIPGIDIAILKFLLRKCYYLEMKPEERLQSNPRIERLIS